MRIALALSLLASPAFAAATLEPAGRPVPPEIVSLPEFKVYADAPLPPAEKWHYVREADFEVLSNISERNTRYFVRDFRDFLTVLSIVAPTARLRSEMPLTVLLCGKGNEFSKAGMKPLVASKDGIRTNLLRDNEWAAIVVDYDTLPIDDHRFHVLETFGWLTERDPYSTADFFREYIRLGLAQSKPRPPEWFAEALANLYAHIDYGSTWIEVGRPKSFLTEVTMMADLYPRLPMPSMSPTMWMEYGSYFGDPLSGTGMGRSLNPFDQLYGPFAFGDTGVLHHSFPIQPFAEMFEGPKNGGRDSRYWQQQVTAFVHMCLYGARQKYTNGLMKFVVQSNIKGVTEELFKECFGRTYKQMAVELRGYIDQSTIPTRVYRLREGTPLPFSRKVAIRAASDSEVGRIKGEALRLAGQDAAAQRQFVQAYLRGGRDPQLLAALGLMARQNNDDQRAKTYLEAAANSGVGLERPRAYLELARLRRGTAGGAALTADQREPVLEPLRLAEKGRPVLAEVYLEYASVWEQSRESLGAEDVALLQRGAKTFPSHPTLLHRIAAVLVRHGHKTEAQPIIERGLQLKLPPEQRKSFEALQKS